MTDGTQLGLELQRAALVQSADGRREAITQIRVTLLAWARLLVQGGNPPELTADDANRAAESLGYLDGDRRYLGNIFVGWPVATNTGRYVASTIAGHHARKIPVWEIAL